MINFWIRSAVNFILLGGAVLTMFGCGFDCVAECREVEDSLVKRFAIPRETVCTEEVFKDTSNCNECDAAFPFAYNVTLSVSSCEGEQD